jgi:hypothetical protein
VRPEDEPRGGRSACHRPPPRPLGWGEWRQCLHRAAPRYQDGSRLQFARQPRVIGAKRFAPAPVVPHNPARARTFRQNPKDSTEPEIQPLWHRRILKPVHVCNVGRSNRDAPNLHSTNQEKSDDEQEREARNKEPERLRERRSATTSFPSALEITRERRTSFALRRMRVYETGRKTVKKGPGRLRRRLGPAISPKLLESSLRPAIARPARWILGPS